MLNVCTHCCTKINNLSVRLNGTSVLEGVNLHVNCGEVVAVVGPNGAGKTTLLRAILGEVPYRGTIDFRRHGSAAYKPVIGYVPQRLEFDPGSPISVADFVACAISRRPVWTGIGKGVLKEVAAVLERFAAGHLMGRKIGELSGGELQRVLLAIAMTPEPGMLLLDEAASGVDVKGLSLFYRIIDELRRKHDIAVVLVTHDLAGAAQYADRLILLDRSVVAEGEPRVVLADERLVKTFGPVLWNVSRLPEFLSAKENGKNHD